MKKKILLYAGIVICCSACLGGELSQKIMLAQRNAIETNTQPDYSEVEEAIEWFKRIFGEDYYIELQRHQTQENFQKYESVKHQIEQKMYGKAGHKI